MKPSTTTSWQYHHQQYQIWLTRMYILRWCTFRPTCFDWYTVYSVQEDQIVQLGHAVLQRHCDLGDCIWNTTWILHQMMTDGKQKYIPKDLLLLMTFLSEINKELWRIYPLKQLHSLQYQTWQLPHGHWKTSLTERTRISPELRATPLYQIGLNQIHMSHFDSGVGASFRPNLVLTDTLCILPGPLKQIHCILSKRVWSWPTWTLCFPTALQLGRLYMTCILHQMMTDGKQEYVPKDQPLLWDYSVFCPRVSYCPDSDILFSNDIATRNTVHDMGFASDDNQWQTGICSCWFYEIPLRNK